ncbi:hypothetical protein FSP39_016331 [Pinctada imbricata]|uniref:Uncharacterized protein n=1 Tax=Pinctada imbricata TaxID=66713 RepID=A0AA89C2J5_PINIB|nr:hypothetical protein FSP39_016331 [Pinctada imbricata]
MLPPGPPTIPFLGNLNLDMSDMMILFRDLRKRYGDIFSLILGKRTVIVVCGIDKLHEVLVKHGDSTSDRPAAFWFKDVFLQAGVGSSNGKQWKELRTTTIKALRDQGVGKKEIETRILEEVEVFLERIQDTAGKPFNIKNLTNISISNVVCSITFGERHDHTDKDFIKLTNLIDDLLSHPYSIGLLMFLPVLQYFPLDPFGAKKMKRYASCIREHCRKVLEAHRKSFNSDEIRDVVDLLIEKQNVYGTSEESAFSDAMVIQTLSDLLIGGTDTTVTTLRWFYLFMIKYPEVQARMRDEIMATIGRNRPITIRDRAHLHYCEAVINETLRLGNIGPFSLPHMVSQDFMLDDYLIPKGAIIMPSLDSVHFDSNHFDDADKFDPLRFLDEKGELTKMKDIMPFSTGRRSCIGESLARVELFLFTTNLLQSFELLPETDTTDPSLEYKLGVTHGPKPYLIRAIPL